jgi:hypothetical protein
MLDERRKLLAERGGVLLAQVDLIVGAGEGETQRLVRRSAVEVVLQRDRYSLGHLNLPKTVMVACTVRRQGHPPQPQRRRSGVGYRRRPNDRPEQVCRW